MTSNLFRVCCGIFILVAYYSCKPQKYIEELPRFNSRIGQLPLIEIDSIEKEVYWKLKKRIDRSNILIAKHTPTENFEEIDLVFYRGKLVAIRAKVKELSPILEELESGWVQVMEAEIDLQHQVIKAKPRIEAWKHVKKDKTYLGMYNRRFRMITRYRLH